MRLHYDLCEQVVIVYVIWTNCFQEILKNEKGNFVASPFSVETVLAFTGEGAKGATATELITGLSLPKSKENIQSVFKSFSRKLKKSDGDLKLFSANKIYVKPGLRLEESFSSTAADIYDAGMFAFFSFIVWLLLIRVKACSQLVTY